MVGGVIILLMRNCKKMKAFFATTIFLLIFTMSESVSAKVETDDLGLVTAKTAAELYQLHRGTEPGQLSLPVAVTIEGIYCVYTATYKDETGIKTLRFVAWLTFLSKEDCPR